MSEKIAVEYIGDGMFEQGVPMRDLTVEEWAQVPPDVQKRLLENKLYKLIKAQKETPAKKEGE